ncbi:MAG: sigma-70 family RNA polymerase sigma factor [Actinomycetota bacterium]|nr:sigma-70 family RNA polymerase sigma factor [Actinomycetota bacterium]
MSPVDALAGEFQQHRSHLLAVGYRLTGSWVDAEDAVQESWLRLQRVEPPRDLRAWLTTVVGRLCLDRLRSAMARRECYVGPWLPEPVVTPLEGAGSPADDVVRDEGVRMAALVVLERLTPEQRVAFVLHDTLSIPFAEIADVLGCSVAAARQHASRARRTVAEADPPPRVGLIEQRAVLDAFVAALASGDLRAVVALLASDAVVLGDGGGHERTARRPVVGADKVARFLLGLQQRYQAAQRAAAATPVLVNGDLGLLFPAFPGDAAHPPLGRRVSCFAVRDSRVTAVYDIVNPGKLTHVPG